MLFWLCRHGDVGSSCSYNVKNEWIHRNLNRSRDINSKTSSLQHEPITSGCHEYCPNTRITQLIGTVR